MPSTVFNPLHVELIIQKNYGTGVWFRPVIHSLQVESVTIRPPICLLFAIHVLQSPFNPFIPEFLKQTLPFLNLDTSVDGMENSVDPYKPSHLDLYCFGLQG